MSGIYETLMQTQNNGKGQCLIFLLEERRVKTGALEVDGL